MKDENLRKAIGKFMAEREQTAILLDNHYYDKSIIGVTAGGNVVYDYAPRKGESVVVSEANTLSDALHEYVEKTNEFIKKAREAEMRKEEMVAAALRMLDSLVLAMRSFEEKPEKECEILDK